MCSANKPFLLLLLFLLPCMCISGSPIIFVNSCWVTVIFFAKRNHVEMTLCLWIFISSTDHYPWPSSCRKANHGRDLFFNMNQIDNVKFAGFFVVDFEDFIIIQKLCMVNSIILVSFLFSLSSLLWQASTLTACTLLLIIWSQNQTQRKRKR